jgi:citrate lyase beta subunit
MRRVLRDEQLTDIQERLRLANAALAPAGGGGDVSRQPVHVVYGGAHLFRAETARKLGAAALASLDAYGGDPERFAEALGLSASDPARDAWLRATVHRRVRDKLAREPIEDFRIDFEDGFGPRSDAEEDAAALQAAAEVARGLDAGLLPPRIGIRVKSLAEEVKRRALRTTELFLATLLAETNGRLPPGFVLTLPKVACAAHVEAFVATLELLEPALALAPRSLRFEIMVETPTALLQADGTSPLPRLVAAGGGRIAGVHFGAYDYTAACDVTAAHQSIQHPACDFARQLLRVALAGLPVHLADGATNVLPIGPHRESAGRALTERERAENAAVVHRAWRLAYRDTTRSLVNGFYQGWDLHPAQLPARFGAVYAFFLDGLDAASARLAAFVQKAAQATLVGDVFDDAATGQGLLNFFLRAIACGAVTLEEACATGLTEAELRSRSFTAIMAGRRAAPGGPARK